jgi:integrase
MPQSELTARQIAELPFGLYLRNPASGWRELPALWAELTVRADLAAVPLRFHIWPAARRKEVRLARWPEDDLTAGVWIIPTERTKGRRLHRVPLSDAARDVLRAASAIRRDELIFPGANHGQPIGEISLRGLLHQLQRGVTAHGFRLGGP